MPPCASPNSTTRIDLFPTTPNHLRTYFREQEEELLTRLVDEALEALLLADALESQHLVPFSDSYFSEHSETTFGPPADRQPSPAQQPELPNEPTLGPALLIYFDLNHSFHTHQVYFTEDHPVESHEANLCEPTPPNSDDEDYTDDEDEPQGYAENGSDYYYDDHYEDEYDGYGSF